MPAKAGSIMNADSYFTPTRFTFNTKIKPSSQRKHILVFRGQNFSLLLRNENKKCRNSPIEKCSAQTAGFSSRVSFSSQIHEPKVVIHLDAVQQNSSFRMCWMSKSKSETYLQCWAGSAGRLYVMVNGSQGRVCIYILDFYSFGILLSLELNIY